MRQVKYDKLRHYKLNTTYKNYCTYINFTRLHVCHIYSILHACWWSPEWKPLLDSYTRRTKIPKKDSFQKLDIFNLCRIKWTFTGKKTNSTEDSRDRYKTTRPRNGISTLVERYNHDFERSPSLNIKQNPTKARHEKNS